MKIIGIDVRQETMLLSESYDISYETLEKARNVFVRIRTDGAFAGCGCAAPDETVTGESPDTVAEAVRGIAAPLLAGEDPLAWLPDRPADGCPAGSRAARLLAALAANSSACAAVEMALWDLRAKQAGLPLYRLLGAVRERIETSITIGIMSLEKTLVRAEERIGQGFRCLKIKGGRDPEEDAGRLRKLRERFGRHIRIRFDANQGYDLDASLRFLRLSREAEVEYLEQPTPADDHGLIASVQSASDVPVMADEGLTSLQDAERLSRNGGVRSFNMKLQKVGGILRAREIADFARHRGIAMMTGCMDEAGLGIAAGLHFSLSHPAVVTADLDGHLDLIDDPTGDAVILRDGFLYPRPVPGLGWELAR